MKKIPFLCRILALVMAMNMILVPAFATQADQLPDDSGTEPEISDTYPLSENISGDASVNSGCRSIHASAGMIIPSELTLDAGAALMYELNTGTMLYSLNPDQKMYPASVTKVMTCLIALDKGNLDDIVTVSANVVENIDPSGSDCKLAEGEQISLKELLYCLMVASANDAASAISEHIAGSEAAFVELMNAKAQELGCTGTHFVNPHGLHHDDHYTTARDLAKIMMAALEYEAFQEIYSTKSHTVPATNTSASRYLLSTNYMIEKTVADHYYDERVIGGKTGFTTPAGRCLAAVSQSGDMRLLTVVLGGSSALNEYGAVLYGSFESTDDLINYAFNNYSTAQILGPDVILTELPVTGGENSTLAVVRESVFVAVPKTLANSQLRYEYILDDGTLTAPIEAGESIGITRIWYQSKCIAQKEIFTSVASKVKETLPEMDPAMQNTAVEEDTDIVQILLMILLVLLVVIFALILVSNVRASIIRRKRAKRRQARRNQFKDDMT